MDDIVMELNGNFRPSLKSLKKHTIPQWYNDAKFGIFIHWNTSCIPAFAPVGKGSSHEIIQKEGWEASFKYTPYAEWYINSIKIPDTPAHEYHLKTYGESHDYDKFIPEFHNSIKKCDPDKWASLISKVNARYVVLVTKHMDGFVMWPSRHKNPKKPQYRSERDIVGELTEAVKKRGMKMGFYYSSMLDYTFDDRPILDVADLITSGSTNREYIKYVESHWRELIDRYSPDILWNDIAYPPDSNLCDLISYYYNTVPDGLINDRWLQVPDIARKFIRTGIGRAITNMAAARSVRKGVTEMPTRGHFDYTTPEYSIFDRIIKKKWECVRGIGTSFGYNAAEPESSYASVKELVHMLVDVTSKNGNLLLNVGPMADGTIPDVQRNRLEGLGAWLDLNGEAIFGTRPWERPDGITEGGLDLRFTKKGNIIYAILLDRPNGSYLTIKNLQINDNARIKILNSKISLSWKQTGSGIRITLPESLPDSPAYAFSIGPVSG